MTTEEIYYTLTYKMPCERDMRIENSCTHVDDMPMISSKKGIISLAYRDAYNVRHYVVGAEWAELVKEWAE